MPNIRFHNLPFQIQMALQGRQHQPQSWQN